MSNDSSDRPLRLIKATRRPYQNTTRDPEATAIDIRRLLEKYGIPKEDVQIQVSFATSRIGVLFRCATKGKSPNTLIPLAVLIVKTARKVKKRARVDGHLKLVDEPNMAELARNIYYMIKSKLSLIAGDICTTEEEFLPYLTYTTAGGAIITLGDRLTTQIREGMLALERGADLTELLALPSVEPEQKTPLVIEAEYKDL